MFYFALFYPSIKGQKKKKKKIVHRYITELITGMYIRVPIYRPKQGRQSLRKVILILLKQSKTDGAHSEDKQKQILLTIYLYK